jgi:hypothetical protein
MAGILSDIPYGALSSTPDQPAQQPVGVLDPRYFALLNAGMNMMANSGPSLQPRSMGQILGQAGQTGLNTFMRARQMQQAEADAVMRRKLLAAQVNKAQLDANLQQQLMGGGALSNMNDPDKLEQLGTRLAAGGHAGGAALIAQAQRMREQMEERQTAESFRSRPGVLGAGVTTTSPQGQALLGNLTGDQSFDSAVLAAQNEALNSNTRLPPQPVQSPRPGLFAPLMTSPYVGQFAQDMQSQIDASKGLKPTQILGQYDRLQQQHITSTNQATARGETADLRRELADQADNTRRMLAAQSRGARTDRQQDLQEQRNFTREQSIEADYARDAKGFKTVLPQFRAAARYVAGSEYNSSGDQAMVYQFVKMNDPNDRVARGDLQDISKLGGIPERFRQWVVSVAQGKELPPRVRQEMFQEMRRKFDSMNEYQQQIEDEYENRAKRYMLNPSNIVQRFSIRKDAKPTKPGGKDKTRLRFDEQGNEIP